MLGEVRPNVLRTRTAVELFEEWELRRKHLTGEESDLEEHRAYWRDAYLGYQGFVWIRDYFGDPDGRIVLDYARMCWKEDHGLLRADFEIAVEESDSDTSLRRRQAHMREYTSQTAGDIHRYVFRKRHSVVGRNPQMRPRSEAF